MTTPSTMVFFAGMIEEKETGLIVIGSPRARG